MDGRLVIADALDEQLGDVGPGRDGSFVLAWDRRAAGSVGEGRADEVDDFTAFRASMAESPVDARWQAEMTALIDPLTDPATGFHQRLEEIFHLD